jgi:periplasmic divalent cation tolerance protein
MSGPELRLILSSCGPDQAQAVADTLIERRAAACVSILPGVLSTYRWQGAVEHEGESLLLIKVPHDAVQRCVDTLVEAHPYEVPEVLVLPVEAAHEAYARWAADQVAVVED